jgi:hypothetical protein
MRLDRGGRRSLEESGPELLAVGAIALGIECRGSEKFVSWARGWGVKLPS